MIVRRRAGFTLLELIVVMALMSIVFFFAIPRFEGSFLFDDSKQSARWLIAKMQSLKEEALRTRREHILVLDLDTKRVWHTTAAMTTEEAELAMRRAQAIPGGARVVGVEFPPETRIDSGRAQIYFYGDGHSDQALIHLQHGDAYSSFLLEPFLTQVRMFDDRVGFNDLR
jgi:prepilin-type N-terminal cleavage/methylation domain-containing protein